MLRRADAQVVSVGSELSLRVTICQRANLFASGGRKATGLSELAGPPRLYGRLARFVTAPSLRVWREHGTGHKARSRDLRAKEWNITA